MNSNFPLNNLDLTTEEGRKVAFLKSSSCMDGINDIDYANALYLNEGQGHYGALCEALKKGKEHSPLSTEDLINWQKLIIEEQYAQTTLPPKAFGIRTESIKNKSSSNPSVSIHQLKSQFYRVVKDINSNLSKHPSFFGPADDAESVKAIADPLFSFHKIQPFSEANGRLERLLTNYIAAWCHFPVIVFRPEENDNLITSFDGIKTLRLFFVNKIREAVYNQGNIMVQKSSDPLNSFYENNDQKLEIQWNNLIRSSQLWK